MEEKVREIFNSHESEDVKIKRLAALIDGCYGCRYEGPKRFALNYTKCGGCIRKSRNFPDHYTPTEPKE